MSELCALQEQPFSKKHQSIDLSIRIPHSLTIVGRREHVHELGLDLGVRDELHGDAGLHGGELHGRRVAREGRGEPARVHPRVALFLVPVVVEAVAVVLVVVAAAAAAATAALSSMTWRRAAFSAARCLSKPKQESSTNTTSCWHRARNWRRVTVPFLSSSNRARYALRVSSVVMDEPSPRSSWSRESKITKPSV